MKKQVKSNSPRQSKYLTREQAKAILEFLYCPELPEHDSPFKLYFNGKLIGSAGTIKSNEPTKPNNYEDN